MKSYGRKKFDVEGKLPDWHFSDEGENKEQQVDKGTYRNLGEVSCMKQPCEQFLKVPKPKKRITNLSVGNITSTWLKMPNTMENKQ